MNKEVNGTEESPQLGFLGAPGAEALEHSCLPRGARFALGPASEKHDDDDDESWSVGKNNKNISY